MMVYGFVIEIRKRIKKVACIGLLIYKKVMVFYNTLDKCFICRDMGKLKSYKIVLTNNH